MATKKTTEEQISKRRQQLRDEHAAAVRERIQVSKIVDRLEKFALGEGNVKMTPARLKAIELLLDKTLPNLASAKVEVDAKNVTFNISTSYDDGQLPTAG